MQMKFTLHCSFESLTLKVYKSDTYFHCLIAMRIKLLCRIFIFSTAHANHPKKLKASIALDYFYFSHFKYVLGKNVKLLTIFFYTKKIVKYSLFFLNIILYVFILFQVGVILNDEKRLNVAISRARKKLILIGSKPTLSSYTPFKNLLNCLREDQFVDIA